MVPSNTPEQRDDVEWYFFARETAQFQSQISSIWASYQKANTPPCYCGIWSDRCIIHPHDQAKLSNDSL